MVPTTCLSKKFKPSLGLDLIDSQSSSPCSHLIGLFVVDVEVSGLDIDQCDTTQSPEVIISSSI